MTNPKPRRETPVSRSPTKYLEFLLREAGDGGCGEQIVPKVQMLGDAGFGFRVTGECRFLDFGRWYPGWQA